LLPDNDDVDDFLQKLSMGQYGKNQSNKDIFRIGSIPFSPLTARSESTRHFDNCKEKSREILDWLINKGIITWCFSSAYPQVFSSGGTCTLLPSFLGVHPFIFFVPPKEELEGTLHPQKFGCTPKNEGKRVHVPPDEKTCGYADEKLLHNLIFQQSSNNPGESDLWLINEDFIYFKGTSEAQLGKILLDDKKILKEELINHKSLSPGLFDDC
jgi:hypothetical protein